MLTGMANNGYMFPLADDARYESVDTDGEEEIVARAFLQTVMKEIDATARDEVKPPRAVPHIYVYGIRDDGERVGMVMRDHAMALDPRTRHSSLGPGLSPDLERELNRVAEEHGLTAQRAVAFKLTGKAAADHQRLQEFILDRILLGKAQAVVWNDLRAIDMELVNLAVEMAEMNECGFEIRRVTDEPYLTISHRVFPSLKVTHRTVLPPNTDESESHEG